MRILVTGSKGMLGQDIVRELTKRNHEVISTTRSELDITNFEVVRQVTGGKGINLIINCAAYTGVDKAESEKELALAINGLGVRNLALVCNELRIPLVHFSTDYVFDGQKEAPYEIFDRPSPVNVYGLSKQVGEFYTTNLLNRYYLIRTSWLFGVHGHNFVETILNLGRGKQEGDLKVVDDQIGSPTFAADLARATADLIETGCYGIYHVTNQGEASWYQFATEILQRVGCSTKVRPVRTYKYPRPAKRPGNSVLNQFPLQETLGYLLPEWQDALGRYLKLREEDLR